MVIISGIWQELEIKILHLFDLVKPHVKGTLDPERGQVEKKISWKHPVFQDAQGEPNTDLFVFKPEKTKGLLATAWGKDVFSPEKYLGDSVEKLGLGVVKSPKGWRPVRGVF